MGRRKKMNKARVRKKDEFYTQYSDIQKEVNSYLEYNPDVFRNKTILLPCDDPEWSNFTRFFAQNFERFGLKKLISTSYATSKKKHSFKKTSLFEQESPHFDEKKSKNNGKLFILERDTDSGNLNLSNLKWSYLEQDGDFRSEEVTKLRDEADIIITNPPFSLFREFLNWIFEGEKKFLIIGNINCISYQEVFLKIMNNEAWLGNGMGRWISGFIVPDDYELYGTEARINDRGERIVATNNALWLTNIEHGKRHQYLELMTMEDNIKFSRHKKIREDGYLNYGNFDAIEVPFTDSIPSDYKGLMGVPITFLDKFNPKQFEIVDMNPHFFSLKSKGLPSPSQLTLSNHGKKDPYARIIIRFKENENGSNI